LPDEELLAPDPKISMIGLEKVWFLFSSTATVAAIQ
jgi:hypothetical protein